MSVVTWDNGSLTAQYIGGGHIVYASQILGDKGKYYCEFLIDELASPCLGIGIKSGAYRLLIYGSPDRDTSMVYFIDNENNNYERLQPIRGYQVGDTVGICIDIDNSKISYYCNNSHCYTAEFLNVTLNGVSPLLGSVSSGVTGLKATANFGATPFKYSIPEGYTSYDGNQSNTTKYLLRDSENYKTLVKEFLSHL